MRQLVLLTAIAASALLLACAPTPSDDESAAAPATASESAVDTTANAGQASAPESSQTMPPQESAGMSRYRAFGTEPFWSVTVGGNALTFTTPDNQPGTTMQGERVPSLRGFTFVGRHDGREFNLDIQQGTCSDGMSDNEYRYTSTFAYDGTTYRGCAELIE